jgi:DNA-3-methyladenine glycosylase
VTLARAFYQRPTVQVARDLVGKTLVRNVSGRRLAGVIVETEAYGHADDPASHAHRGMTGRNSVMFGPAGMAYVYFTYGNHYCVNVSARDGALAGAVLIRSVEPVDGIATMKRLRGMDDVYLLASGPGRLTQAMKITRAHNGMDMTSRGSGIFIEDGPARRVVSTTRIGISRAVEKEWRFFDPASPFVSRRPRLASLQVK